MWDRKVTIAAAAAAAVAVAVVVVLVVVFNAQALGVIPFIFCLAE